MKAFQKDLLRGGIFSSRKEMGERAAEDIRRAIEAVIREKGTCNMIFAAAPSQNEVLASLSMYRELPWEKVNAFHMDEYIGLSADAPQGFGNFLKNAIFSKVPFGKVCRLDSTNDPEKECERYAELLKEYPADIVCMGIGENGHIAFNDPHVADFHDSRIVKIVDLDDVCRMQQVHDGCFASIDEVPKQALTLTIPVLTAPKYVFCVVPGKTKAEAVEKTVNGAVSPSCPASILRTHENAVLYLDEDSAEKLNN